AAGAGATALAKVLVVCAGTVGGTAACVATGVAPAPADLSPDRVEAPTIERVSQRVFTVSRPAAIDREPAVDAVDPEPTPATNAPEIVEPAPSETETDVVEYAEPVPEPAESVEAEAPGAASGTAAGEFGP
ncbi:MAG TPA: hypothetical protein VF729_09465, partial [Solirubrobacterales bacterium]